ncbi:MAG TPA: hypothetical protein VH917_00940, partial [Ignavibacteriaceae bacterium]
MITKQTKFILFLLYFFVVLIFPVTGQRFHSEFWSDVSEASIIYTGTRYIIPEQYRTLELNIENISIELTNAPKEKNIKVQDSDFLVDLPMPDGISLTFR